MRNQTRTSNARNSTGAYADAAQAAQTSPDIQLSAIQVNVGGVSHPATEIVR